MGSPDLCKPLFAFFFAWLLQGSFWTFSARLPGAAESTKPLILLVETAFAGRVK
jgi:hypothetical protein